MIHPFLCRHSSYDWNMIQNKRLVYQEAPQKIEKTKSTENVDTQNEAKKMQEVRFNQNLLRLGSASRPEVQKLKQAFTLTYTLTKSRIVNTTDATKDETNLLRNLNALCSTLLDNPPLEMQMNGEKFTLVFTTPEVVRKTLNTMQDSSSRPGEIPTDSAEARNNKKAYKLLNDFKGNIPEENLAKLARNYVSAMEKVKAFDDLYTGLRLEIWPKPKDMNDVDWEKLLKEIGYKPGEKDENGKVKVIYSIGS